VRCGSPGGSGAKARRQLLTCRHEKRPPPDKGSLFRWCEQPPGWRVVMSASACSLPSWVTTQQAGILPEVENEAIGRGDAAVEIVDELSVFRIDPHPPVTATVCGNPLGIPAMIGKVLEDRCTGACHGPAAPSGIRAQSIVVEPVLVTGRRNVRPAARRRHAGGRFRVRNGLWELRSRRSAPGRATPERRRRAA
jgi:hypothetical protein